MMKMQQKTDIQHVYLVGVREIIGTTKKTLVI